MKSAPPYKLEEQPSNVIDYDHLDVCVSLPGTIGKRRRNQKEEY
jgi:hypothetical protein